MTSVEIETERNRRKVNGRTTRIAQNDRTGCYTESHSPTGRNERKRISFSMLFRNYRLDRFDASLAGITVAIVGQDHLAHSRLMDWARVDRVNKARRSSYCGRRGSRAVSWTIGVSCTGQDTGGEKHSGGFCIHDFRRFCHFSCLRHAMRHSLSEMSALRTIRRNLPLR